MYPDHFHLVWSNGLITPDFPHSYQPFHDLIFTYRELPEVMGSAYESEIYRLYAILSQGDQSHPPNPLRTCKYSRNAPRGRAQTFQNHAA